MKLFSLVRNDAPPSTQWSSSLVPTSPQSNYQQFARAYSTNEIVYACVDLLGDSASEPQIIGRRYRRNSPNTRNVFANLFDTIRNHEPKGRRDARREFNRLRERGVSWGEADQTMVRNGFYETMPNHPLVRLVNNPNPLTTEGQMWGTVVMDKKLAGNAYLLKARYTEGPLKGSVAELWRLRPDRVKIIPLPNGRVSYEYNTGQDKIVYSQEDVLHFKERNPLDDYYGMPPLMSVMGRLSVDQYMRSFLTTFFEQGGAGPGAVLTVKQKLSQEMKDDIRARFKKQFGRGGWHEMLVLDQNEASYTQMGLTRGLRDAIPKELDAVNEARISMVFRIPGSIIGLLIGYESSSYANKRQDWQVFWDLTMTPELSELDDVLNKYLVPDFGGIDELCFDLSDIKALQEDVDKIQDRHRKNLMAGVEFWEEAREAMGLDPEAQGTLLVPSNMVPIMVKAGKIVLPEPPAPEPPQIEAPQNIVAEVHCPKCGRWVGRNMNVGATAYCPKDKEVLVTMPGDSQVISIEVLRDEEGRVKQLVGASE